MAFKIKVIETGLRTFIDYDALLKRKARIGQGTAVIKVNDGQTKKKETP